MRPSEVGEGTRFCANPGKGTELVPAVGLRPAFRPPLRGCPRGKRNEQEVFVLWDFQQFHLAIAAAVKHKQVPIRIAKDQQIAVAGLCFLDGFFDG